MVKKSFTLIEMIFVIVILSIIITGGMMVAEKIYKRNILVSKSLSLQFDTQQVIDKLANLLYYRIPLSAIGYNSKTGDFKYLGEITNTDKYKVFEWIGEAFDIEKGLNFSGFADLYASKKPTLKALDFNTSFINDVMQNKFDKNLKDACAIIFAGSFDRGDEASLGDYNDSFGWHGNKANYVFLIKDYLQNDNDTNLSLTNYDGSEINNKRIYEKFYLVDSAYAIARGADINTSADCIKNLNIPENEINNTLFLFYDYRPWKNETFCADNKGTAAGKVEVLSKNITGFNIQEINSHLELFFKAEYRRGDITIKVSKQKVVF